MISVPTCAGIAQVETLFGVAGDWVRCLNMLFEKLKRATSPHTLMKPLLTIMLVSLWYYFFESSKAFNLIILLPHFS